jgi:hypothetical protein
MTEPSQNLDCVDAESGEIITEEEEAAFKAWWAHLPDFIQPDYPFDVPPARRPFAQFVFTMIGAPRFCPEARCRRAGACGGGDGPPCYRADRAALRHVLFLWWMAVFYGIPDEEFDASMRSKATRYASDTAAAKPARSKGRRARRTR